MSAVIFEKWEQIHHYWYAWDLNESQLNRRNFVTVREYTPYGLIAVQAVTFMKVPSLGDHWSWSQDALYSLPCTCTFNFYRFPWLVSLKTSSSLYSVPFGHCARCDLSGLCHDWKEWRFVSTCDDYVNAIVQLPIRWLLISIRVMVVKVMVNQEL